MKPAKQRRAVPSGDMAVVSADRKRMILAPLMRWLRRR
jgi:hypothetical protein